MRDVDVDAGSGEHYRATYGASPASARATADLGIVAHGSLPVPGRDHRARRRTTPTDRAPPARAAVRRISRSFA